jgi:UDP-N-acetylmuramate--L-alanine ligase
MIRKSERHYFSTQDALEDVRSFFFVGIGGSGMSSLARMLHQKGYEVRGVDRDPSKNSTLLKSLGIDVFIGHDANLITSEDAVVFTDAVWLESSPEFKRAQELGCKLFRRSQILGWLLRDKKIIAITGTHGKTTTTSLVATALKASGLDPTILVGAEVPQLGGAVIEGKGEWAVVEACEAYDGYHDLNPHIILLTNVEPDHLDYHESYEGLCESVQYFINKLPQDGWLVYCEEDPGACKLAAEYPGNKKSYKQTTFDELAPHAGHLQIAGTHNRLNAGGALVAAILAGASLKKSVEAILQFKGACRRMEIHLEEPVLVMDDYGHHPTEIRETIKALRERYPGRRIIFVFQPQLYSRTAQFKAEFAKELSEADHVVITDIFPSREEPMPGVSALHIVELITTKPVDYVPSRHLLPRFLKSIANPGDIILGSGVGNIGEMGHLLAAEFKRQGPVRVAVIYGGDNAEREVSIYSKSLVCEALRSKGYDVFALDITEQLLTTGDLSMLTGPHRPDVAFLATYGKHAEDGCLQGLFELLHIPYTGSDVLTSAICFDKQLTKKILSQEGIHVPPGILLREIPKDPLPFPYPVVVKPNQQGSTVGLSYVNHEEELLPALEKAFVTDEAVLVEMQIKGIELSVPVLGDQVLPVVEIVPKEGIYDFAAKYTPGLENEIVPARVPEYVYLLAQETALKVHSTLGCRGPSRTDMIYDGRKMYVLEVNTLPGLTGTSIMPCSARAMGMSYADLCAAWVEEALSRGCARRFDVSRR